MPSRMAKWMILCCQENLLARYKAARTRNRLRWSGREYQGDTRDLLSVASQDAETVARLDRPDAHSLVTPRHHMLEIGAGKNTDTIN